MTHAVPSSTSVSPTADADDATVTFAELGLPEPVVAALARNSITVPSPIQAKALPDAIAGKNVLGRAQTGSGKTLAFGLPILARLAQHTDRPAAKRPRALVLVPTRELAFQVVDSLSPYAGAVGLNVRAAVGGTPFNKQVEQLRRGIDVFVATPGRLADHLRQGTCVLDAIEITALDEADQMADMGFLPEVRAVLAETPSDGQRMLFSATLDREVQSLVRQFLPDHVEHSTQDGKASVRTMDHYMLMVDRGQKDLVLSEIGAREGGRTIMFARTKLGCDGITDRLRAVGVAAESLHGGKAQNQRTRVLERFKSGRTPVLVATDVAARGIHVDGIDLVVHVDPPADHKDYLHRAGRTARAGEKGTVVAIVLPNQRRQIQRLTGMAGVKATSVNVAPGSAELTDITGAQKPSGEPLRAVSSGVRDRRDDRPRSGSYQGDRPRSGGYQGDRPRTGGYQGDRPRTGGYQGDRPRTGGYQGDRPRTGGYQGDRPRTGGYQGDRPRTGGYQGDRPRTGGYQGDRPRTGGYQGDRPRTGGYQGDRPRTGGYQGDNSRTRPSYAQDDAKAGGFRSRTERRSYDGFDGPARAR
ncbi:DEAD/DEAH box helicase [Rhodococcus sp. BP-252]|uniref:DEAD/DEAH box helicase n=1 Tax=unclassified Rhodococcus (in: high G+C Gram-positive bacteria) TaxID=192944 RepID=UPI00142F5F92|nr:MULTISPECIES: DEAD/DEAH box helicase [unclassified Rhodococcus (in: high G+C Gram-positive bacteria)]NIL75535.1 ATP-dependent RNA helicase DeaD [Rhodococcus sp. B10]MBY6410145.1 DEAD/DEAH box helicase [Rhodococcus sp. BP-320]MBY6415114.1 DEAD/DEAH box helicase [Rhodococcus sp. BP-321]MBY6425578.1 DEAD/DEAH box helicase [Rhodococcus sp. BP-323]MBY6430010.1 DEAD/DEAH box helicase [Rhodococcus sp. BP-322]